MCDVAFSCNVALCPVICGSHGAAVQAQAAQAELQVESEEQIYTALFRRLLPLACTEPAQRATAVSRIELDRTTFDEDFFFSTAKATS